jgi:hypothetical protein
VNPSRPTSTKDNHPGDTWHTNEALGSTGAGSSGDGKFKPFRFLFTGEITLNYSTKEGKTVSTKKAIGKRE